MLKSYGWGGGGSGGVGWVAHEILVSAQGPLVSGFGAKGLGPGLDNIRYLVKIVLFGIQILLRMNIFGIQYSIHFQKPYIFGYLSNFYEPNVFGI